MVFASGTALFATSMLADQRSWTSFGLSFSKQWFKECFYGCLAGFAAISFLTLTFAGAGWLNIIFHGFNLSSFVQLMGFMIGVAVWEELATRSYLQTTLRERFELSYSYKRASLIALFISAIIFGLLHGANPNLTWLAMVNIILAGLLLGLPIYRSGHVGASIGFHFSWNWSMGPLLGIQVSGINMENTVFISTLSGPDWLTGGNFGFEGGFGATLMLIILSLLVFKFIPDSKPDHTLI